MSLLTKPNKNDETPPCLVGPLQGPGGPFAFQGTQGTRLEAEGPSRARERPRGA
jgi:hypothetical protein